jgi:ABC-type uncharacterized transport system substrate-binding protein
MTSTRAAVVYDVNSPPSPRPDAGLVYAAIDAAKGSLTLSKQDVRSATLANDIATFATARGGPGGLIVAAGTPMATIRKTIIPAAASANLPAVYGNRLYVFDGGLISRGAYTPNLYLYAGNCAKQIMNGTPPPQAIDISQTGNDPCKPAVFETVINLNTAKALGGNIPANAKAISADLVID